MLKSTLASITGPSQNSEKSSEAAQTDFKMGDALDEGALRASDSPRGKRKIGRGNSQESSQGEAAVPATSTSINGNENSPVN